VAKIEGWVMRVGITNKTIGVLTDGNGYALASILVEAQMDAWKRPLVTKSEKAEVMRKIVAAFNEAQKGGDCGED